MNFIDCKVKSKCDLVFFFYYQNDREVKVEQRRLKEKMKEFNKKEAKFYGNMFAKLSVSISLILPAHIC